jgi:hypothetical protein
VPYDSALNPSTQSAPNYCSRTFLTVVILSIIVNIAQGCRGGVQDLCLRGTHGCENWSLTLREESGLRVFENRVLRRIFGPKRADVTGEWRTLHNEEPNELLTQYRSGDKIGNNEIGGACSVYGGE